MKKIRNLIGVRLGMAACLLLAYVCIYAQPTAATVPRYFGITANASPALLALAAAPQAEEHAAEASEEHSAEASAEHAAGAEGEHGEGEAEHHSLLDEIFHWFNLLVLVGALVFLVKKLLIPFLNERGRLIREDMDRSAKALADADQRLSVVEEKMKSVDEEMASLRQAARHESAAEHERIEKAAAADAQKVFATAEQEIDAAVKSARQELKRYTAELALGLAEKNIRSSLTPSSEQRILKNFVQELSAGEGEGNGHKSAAPSEK